MMADKKEIQPESELNAGTKSHIQGLADQSKKNLANGGETIKVDLNKLVEVRFTKDIGFIKAGHEQTISQLAYDIYKAKNVVELKA